ncbi:MAG: Hpt domain-containing protein [Brevundimonas sp.]|uniref:Hpt domain-containing protein n=1 Tax=Brevundimonas sp. TaxID=1871086 RepID=UPI00391DFD83
MTDPLAALRERFRARTVADRVELERLAGGDPTGEDLRRLVHNLAGAAGTFGYGALSQAAAEIDDQMAAGRPAEAASLDRLKQKLDEVGGPAS